MKTFLLSAVFALATVPAFAQGSLTLDIQDGRVNMDATSVPARQILAEWARIGGTKIVGADEITGAPLTLKFENIPEQQALDIILRNVAGYMAAPRRAAAEPGASAYDRIVILPTSAGVAPAPANAGNVRMPGNPGPMAGTERRVPPRPPGMPDPEADMAEMQPEAVFEPTDNAFANQAPVFTFPQPQVPGNQVFVPVQQGGFGVPGQPGTMPQITMQPGADGQPAIYNFMPTAPAPAGTGGFAIIGSPTPGMVQQPAPAPGQPVPVPPKPPGGN
jgi:hypothetical protein